MIGHPDIYTAYDMFPFEQIEKRINHLRRKYTWTLEEAENWYYYEPYDEEDWRDYD